MLVFEIALGVFIGGLALRFPHAAILLAISLLGLVLALALIGAVVLAVYVTWPASENLMAGVAIIAAALYGFHLLDNASGRILAAWRRHSKPDS